MDMAQLTLVVATLLCALTAGFLFAFAVVVMPGTRALPDADFLRSFQVMDRVIQENEPLFVLVWVGSVVAIAASVVVALGTLEGGDRLLVILAAAVYLAGVQAPTFLVNVPLNNGLKALEVDTLDEADLRAARAAFEARWNRWNRIRTGLACLTTLTLLVVLQRL